MSRFRVIAILITVLIIAVALVASGILPRLRERQTLRAQANTTAIPMVTVVHPKREVPAEEVVLPGNIQAFIDAPIYARTSGYLRRWYFDIGSRVKVGQLLAEIESPEVDQQLQQAREDLSTAEANLKLAEITAERYSALLKQDSIAKQDVDTAVQNAAARRSAVKSAQANVNRVQQMVAFEKIYAPFNGVITARNTDVGQLISSGSSSNANRELFHIAAINKLRVFVSVPQTYSHVTTPGLKADLTLPELPGQRFPGTLVRTSDAMDQNTRTLLVEVDVVNSTGLLFPGAYAQVHFKMKSQNPALIIPSASLVFRSEGLRVPVVTGNRANLIPVTLGRDFGSTVEVLSGLNEDTAVIADPPDSLVSGQEVRIRQKQAEPEGER
ncbi:MAG: efflux RND transporter periplasmic adaptor subunit [Acidobacteriaceae bacterium]|nr:efflux RND transporter periplasmic adaptor subunit [Acidobacteriaceae bacterium]